MSTENHVHILMVDDQPANLLALEAVLEPLGHSLVAAHSGAEALKHLLRAEFAVILLDVFMPGMDGFETATLIRQRDRTRHTPIIFLTAIGKSDTEMFRGYSVGAIDYLFKPIIPEVLRYKVAAFVDLYLKTEEVKRQAEQLREMERREHEAKLAEARRQLEAERLRHEMRIARAIQQRFFPTTPPARTGLTIAGASYPADATGGDYFDFIEAPDGSIHVVIGDVSGHGYGPALLMATARAYLRALALTHQDVSEILTLANRAIAADVSDDQFVTLLLARLEPETRSCVYASAGHPTGYLLDAAGEVKGVLESTAYPLGIFAEGEFPAARPFTLSPGDLLFLHTDGLVEAASADDAAFGCRRALDVVRAHRHLAPGEIVHTLYESVLEFTEHRRQLDDITAIAVKAQ